MKYCSSWLFWILARMLLYRESMNFLDQRSTKQEFCFKLVLFSWKRTKNSFQDAAWYGSTPPPNGRQACWYCVCPNGCRNGNFPFYFAVSYLTAGASFIHRLMESDAITELELLLYLRFDSGKHEKLSSADTSVVSDHGLTCSVPNMLSLLELWILRCVDNGIFFG